MKNRLDYTPNNNNMTFDNNHKFWFFKTPYHPQNPTSQEIHQAWNEAVETSFLRKRLEDINIKFKKIGKRRFITCYSRAPNLGNLLSYRKLKNTPGLPVSSFFK